MLTTHAVGIDLGTTYSCIAYLNEHGEPVTLANEEGELSTPSVVLFDGGEVIVGTEALRNAIVNPKHVVQNSKRFMGDSSPRWVIEGRPYTPVDIATFIVKKLLSSAQRQIGPISQAVITVPAQFSDSQRHATVEAGHRAGLERVDIINEPVAAALCHVLGSEGLWFSELAEEQRILVYDLGGGTFDLSLVAYRKNEVKVIASSGDLHLGGIDWNHALEKRLCTQFTKAFGKDPRDDSSSLQALALEVEQTKRSLSVRPRAALTVQHAGHRKTFQVDIAHFERLTQPHVERTAEITRRLLKENKLGWAHVDVVLLTGGASRMPMIRKTLKEMSGRTLNTSLSPDLSIAHGATYYAGMLLSNDQFARSILSAAATERLSQVRQQSVNARALGVLVRDPQRRVRVPHYLIDANTPLPVAKTHTYGTVVPNQRRVHLQIVESGTSPDAPPAVLGRCVIDDIAPNLPENSEIAVTISYDAQARVHVSATDVSSGKHASTEIIRQENLVPQLAATGADGSDVAMLGGMPARLGGGKKKARPDDDASKTTLPPSSARPALPRRAITAKRPASPAESDSALDAAEQPVPLCNKCGKPLDVRGRCRSCGASPTKGPAKPPQRPGQKPEQAPARAPAAAGTPKPRQAAPRTLAAKDPDFEMFNDESTVAKQRASRASKTVPPPVPQGKANRKPTPKSKSPSPEEVGEDEFWELVE